MEQEKPLYRTDNGASEEMQRPCDEPGSCLQAQGLETGSTEAVRQGGQHMLAPRGWWGAEAQAEYAERCQWHSKVIGIWAMVRLQEVFWVRFSSQQPESAFSLKDREYTVLGDQQKAW